MLTRDKIITTSRSWIGTPYHHQASVKHAGCDCLGLLRGVYREINDLNDDPEPIPSYSPDWAESNKGREDMLSAANRYLDPIPMKEYQPGDVIVFRFRPTTAAKHCAIVSYNDRMIHAHSGKTVIEVPIVPWWRTRIVGSFQFRGIE